ncbi:MAG TPA: glycosyltransferase family 9 protein [Roseiflexaceae bacterium]|nr:glycosyltransferase family 9 protein [Roseiflexaceae bacterium]
MQRFTDQPLGSHPHLAVFGSDKVGNFVVTTPLLRGLKEKYPGATLDFFGGATTRDLEEACPYIDARFSLYGEREDYLGELNAFVGERRAAAGAYDLAINCDEFSELNLVVVAAVAPRYLVGASLQPDFRRKLPPGDGPRDQILRDGDWNSPAFLARYGELLESNYLGEIFCRLSYVETDFFRIEVESRPPRFAVPDVLLHMTTTRSAKQWLPDYWRLLVDWCLARGLSVGVLGSKPQIERERYHAGDWEEHLIVEKGLRDLRGETALTELAGAFKHARAAVVVDAGPMHVAAAVGCPTVCIFGNDGDGDGASPIALWAPRGPNARVVRTPAKCRVCIEHRFKNEACLVDGHPCMRELRPERVIAALEQALQGTPPSITT